VKIKEFAENVEGIIAGDVEMRVLVHDQTTGEYHDVQELATDTERRNLYIVINPRDEGQHGV
jgi:hypothetical protein